MWLGDRAHQPLASALSSARFLSSHLGSDNRDDAVSAPTDYVRANDINNAPRPSLSMLNLFSGPYRRNRNDGLSRTVKTFGWDSVTDVDNHSTLGVPARVSLPGLRYHGRGPTASSVDRREFL